MLLPSGRVGSVGRTQGKKKCDTAPTSEDRCIQTAIALAGSVITSDPGFPLSNLRVSVWDLVRLVLPDSIYCGGSTGRLIELRSEGISIKPLENDVWAMFDVGPCLQLRVSGVEFEPIPRPSTVQYNDVLSSGHRRRSLPMTVARSTGSLGKAWQEAVLTASDYSEPCNNRAILLLRFSKSQPWAEVCSSERTMASAFCYPLLSAWYISWPAQ